jgi:hypothetical protein
VGNVDEEHALVVAQGASRQSGAVVVAVVVHAARLRCWRGAHQSEPQHRPAAIGKGRRPAGTGQARTVAPPL